MFTVIKAIWALIFAAPSYTNSDAIGVLAGNGAWNSEDADHLKAGN